MYQLNKLIILFCLWSICATLSLTGCSKDIPSASIIGSGKVTLSWNEVPSANSYNVYGSTSPGVTKLTGKQFRNVPNPYTITKLKPGTTYYFVITVLTDSGESKESKELSFTAVANSSGSIEFGDILSTVSQTKPETVNTEIDNVQTTSPSDSKPLVKQEQQEGQISSIRSNAEVIICFGDSLTFGTGASRGMDYPSQLSKMIGREVINKGIPGDTTSTALRRLKRDVLSINPDIVLITLGGNDLKNGISKRRAFGNLKQIIQAIQKQGAKVIIGGLKFPGMDRGYGKGYEDLAQDTGALLIPDILAGIVNNPNLMSDPIHPNYKGYRIMALKFRDAIASFVVDAKSTVN